MVISGADETARSGTQPSDGRRLSDGILSHSAISFVIPTRNERHNIAELVRRIHELRLPVPAEVVFVDDSDDGTPDAIREVASSHDLRIRVHHRSGERRTAGLGGAVVDGLRRAHAPWVCVMDADLQHPPELTPAMLEEAQRSACDIVIASRYCSAGSSDAFGRVRSFLSRASTFIAKTLFPSRLRGVTDPMSGFFMVRRDAVDPEELRPQGFKILLDILVRTPGLRVREVPFRFGERIADESKASLREALRYLALVGRLRFGAGSSRMARFALVGLTGIAINTGLLVLFTEYAGIHYLWSAVIATQGSTAWNFVFTELWVFRGRAHGKNALVRFGSFWAMNNAALWVRDPALYLLTSIAGIQYVVSNLVTLGMLVVARFALADSWIWSASRSRTKALGVRAYDIHGIISVLSDAPLPELEKFEVPRIEGEPTIRVRVGKVLGEDAQPTGTGTRRIVYDEGLGPFGFGMSIEIAERTEVMVSSLLRFSKHVLYTNVVEPILRWHFVERGYVLVHGACVAIGDDAYLITARTDTGKTTTMLKTLDVRPWSFLSDDLTLLSPSGRVLMYPKPMTISRHTVHAVRTPRLSAWQRIALIVQSRVHSRSGRIFAMLIARTHLPVATVNTFVQMIIPPPKYHVEKLIPGVHTLRAAALRGMVVIQRGAEGESRISETKALQILMENCEDAYGFPPYHTIEHFLHSANGSDLRARERAYVARALAGHPTTVLKSTTMDWAARLPALLGDAHDPSSLAPVTSSASDAHGADVVPLAEAAQD